MNLANRRKNNSMPLFRKINDADSKVWGGIWNVTESEDELCGLLPETFPYKSEADGFTLKKRRMEFLAVRALVNVLMPDAPRIVYRPTGKPYFENDVCRLSISHTANYVAVLFSRIAEVGIDIETVSNRVMKLRQRIVSSREKADTLYETLLHWSAKETAFKILDTAGLDFCRNLCVKELVCVATAEHPESEGTFTMCIQTDKLRESELKVHFQTTSDYVLTYAALI